MVDLDGHEASDTSSMNRSHLCPFSLKLGAVWDCFHQQNTEVMWCQCPVLGLQALALSTSCFLRNSL